MYYIKIYSDGKYNNQQRRISKTNVTLAFVTNVAWIGWAIDDLKRAEFTTPLKEKPQNLDEVYDSDAQSVPESPVRVREEDEVSFTSADVLVAQRFERRSRIDHLIKAVDNMLRDMQEIRRELFVLKKQA